MLRRISRAQLRAFALTHVRSAQGGLCGICSTPINFTVQGRQSDYCVDHDHETGEIRGVLHRSCNAAEGKVANAAGCWGAKSMSFAARVAWLKQLIQYLEKPGTGVMYPGHKSADEQEQIKKQKRRVASAASRARAKLKGSV